MSNWKFKLDALWEETNGEPDFSQVEYLISETIKSEVEEAVKKGKLELLEKILNRAWIHEDEIKLLELGTPNGRVKNLPEGRGYNRKADEMTEYLNYLKSQINSQDEEEK